MNLSVAIKIINFCELSRNYYLPPIVRNNIMLLFKLTSKWLSLYYSELETKTHLTVPIEKVLINLGDIMPNNCIDDRLTHSYGKIFSQCYDRSTLDSKEIDDLVTTFKNISLQYDMPDLMDDFLDIKI